MTGVDPEVIAFYERGDEAGRLESLGRLEFARTMELLGASPHVMAIAIRP
jgi:hypothetical protein